MQIDPFVYTTAPACDFGAGEPAGKRALRSIGPPIGTGEQVQRILLSVHGSVLEGRRLSEAMSREAASFPPLYRAMVAAGEGSGLWPQILERLADLLERQAQVRGKVLSALAYPVILAFVATFVVFALMVFVVPKVVEQFEDVGQELRSSRGSSSDSRNSWRTGGGLSSSRWWRLHCSRRARFGTRTLRLRFDRSLLRLPIFGRLLRDLHAARMARTLSTMVASRLPLLEGLKLTTKTVHNRALRLASAGHHGSDPHRREPFGGASAGGCVPALARLSGGERRGIGQARRHA
jgi:general secretion pathway protein F